MLLETFLMRLLRIYLSTSVSRHSLLDTLKRIIRSCSSSSFVSPAQTTKTSMRAVVSPILPGRLYLSGITAALSPSTLDRYGITHVLSVVHSTEAPQLDEKFNHKIVPVSDTTTTNILQHLPDAVSYIEAALQDQNARVLVHCVEGVSRSASTVIAYLMSERGMSFPQALRVVRRRRAIVSPNIGFVRQLREWGVICEAKRLEKPREWEQVLLKRKATSSPPPPVRVEKVQKRNWANRIFASEVNQE